MKLNFLLSSLAMGASLVVAAPTALSARAAGDKGSYTVSGLGSRKQAILDAGGNTLDLAIAMLETEDMQTDYPYGKHSTAQAGGPCTNITVGDNKSGDSANFGVFKQNWGMLRVCASQAGFVGQSSSEYNNGAELNSDLSADVASRQECQNYYGEQKWFAGHRNGASGLSNPDTDDINTYKNAVYWIQSQIDSSSNYKTDDTRFWVDVTPI